MMSIRMEYVHEYPNVRMNLACLLAELRVGRVTSANFIRTFMDYPSFLVLRLRLIMKPLINEIHVKGVRMSYRM